MYEFKLEKFQGPLDLLLELIEKEQMSITDIALSQITDEYLRYIESAQDVISLDELASFIEIASRLLLIKSKTLMPLLEINQEEEKDINELKMKLEIYKVFKNLARNLQKRYAQGRPFLSRQVSILSWVIFYPPENITKERLQLLFKGILNEVEELRKKIVYPGKVIKKLVSLKEKIQEIEERIKKDLAITFSQLTKNSKSKMEIVVSFLAILELVKRQIIIIEQKDIFEEIKIKNVNLSCKE